MELRVVYSTFMGFRGGSSWKFVGSHGLSCGGLYGFTAFFGVSFSFSL